MDLKMWSKGIRQHRQMLKRDKWTREQLEEHQAKALKNLRAYTYAKSPFYKEFHKGYYDRPLEELPVLSKDMVMEQFDKMVTDPSLHLTAITEHLEKLSRNECFQDEYYVTATSGSTGRRGIFVFNTNEWVTVVSTYTRANIMRGFKLKKFGRTKITGIASNTNWHQSSRVGATLDTWLFPTIYLDAGEPISEIVANLNIWQPVMLSTYPTVARILAQEQLEHRLLISPEYIFTAGETLSDQTRLWIKQVWGHEPFDAYGSTEAGIMACECSQHEGMHIFEDTVIVEAVDKNNRPVPDKAWADKILITVLFNYTQPLIRYELSDMVSLNHAPCACGRPYWRIDKIQGRNEEVQYFKKHSGQEVPVHPIVFENILEALPCRNWQLIWDKDTLTILLSDLETGFNENTLKEDLEKVLKSQGLVIPPILVQKVAEIPRGKTGKAPRFKFVQ